jgi:hypothetical protein
MKFLFLVLFSFSAFSQTEKFSATINSKTVGIYKLDLIVSLPHTRDIVVEQKTYVYNDDQYSQWACMIQARSLEPLTWRANLGGKLFNGRSDLIYSISENLENEFQPCPLFFQEGQHPVSLTGVPYLRLEIEKGLFLTVSLYSGLWHGLADLTETTFNMELESLRTQSRQIRGYDVHFSVTRESQGSTSFLEHGTANFDK